MSSVKKAMLAAFGIVFVASFAYLFVQQRFFPTSFVAPPTNQPIVQPNPGISQNSASVKKFASIDEFKTFMAGIPAQNSYLYADGFGGGMERSLTAAPMVTGMPGDSADFSSPEAKTIDSNQQQGPDYSQTNVQVVGVDEADIVKSDGQYLYVVAGNAVNIVSAVPADQAKIISIIDQKAPVQDVYLNGNIVAVTSQDARMYGGVAEKRIAMPIRWSGSVVVTLYDVTDKASPKQIRSLTFEGSVVSSRMVGDYIYLITQKYGYDESDPNPLPKIMDGDVQLIDPAKGLMPPLYYFDIPYYSASLTSVSAINVKDASASPKTEVYVMDSGQTVYASPKNLYITYTKHLDTEEVMFNLTKKMLLGRLAESDRQRITAIEQTPAYILNTWEKRSKIMQIIQRYVEGLTPDEQSSMQKDVEGQMAAELTRLKDQLERTVVHRIAIDNGTLTYQKSGDVPGYVINQFAMDELDGNLRLATTRSQQWVWPMNEDDQKSYSNVYVLDENLKQIGAVENLAPGERIYAVRFMQGRAYLVTFQQVDPLFVIDVSVPTSPKVLGELKVPGFSNYLQPFDDTTLLGIGKDTDTTDGRVRTKGVKLSLFDVSDVANPKELANYVLTAVQSDSEALRDHKAVLFSPKKNLLVIPVSEYGYDDAGRYDASRQFNGAQAFRVSKDGIVTLGRISHSASKDEWDSQIRRSMYIDDMLYTISQRYVQANDLTASLEQRAKVQLDSKYSQPDVTPYPMPTPFMMPGVRAIE